MNNSKWFYCFNCYDDRFAELDCEIYKIPENPSHDELDAIAQKLLRDYGYTDDGNYVWIGKGELIAIEALGGCLGIEIIEILENSAADIYGCEDELFSGASKEDIKDLDSRIEQVLKEWEEERNVMSSYYTIPDPECYYYHGDNYNREEQK